MNVANIEASLITLINNAVTSTDLDRAPLNTPELVRNLRALIVSANAETNQHAVDLARSNRVAASLHNQGTQDFSK
jgi:hypothetical protein